MAGDINYRSRGAALRPGGWNCSRAFSAHFYRQFTRFAPSTTFFAETSLASTSIVPVNHGSGVPSIQWDAAQKIIHRPLIFVSRRRLIFTTPSTVVWWRTGFFWMKRRCIIFRPMKNSFGCSAGIFSAFWMDIPSVMVYRRWFVISRLWMIMHLWEILKAGNMHNAHSLQNHIRCFRFFYAKSRSVIYA